MALSVATNTSAATAHRYLRTNDMEASRSLAKLSSGSRIVRASDDAASLAVGTKLKADVAALKQAQVNASQGQSVLQVADGAAQQVSDILIRMKALATQAVSGSISDTERGYLNSEFTQLATQLDQYLQPDQVQRRRPARRHLRRRLRRRHRCHHRRDQRGDHPEHERHRPGAERQHGRDHRRRAGRGHRRSTRRSATCSRRARPWARRCRGSTSSAPISRPRSRTSTRRARP